MLYKRSWRYNFLKWFNILVLGIFRKESKGKWSFSHKIMSGDRKIFRLQLLFELHQLVTERCWRFSVPIIRPDLTFVYFWGNVFRVLTISPSFHSIQYPGAFLYFVSIWLRSIYFLWHSVSSLFVGRTRKILSYSEVLVPSTKYWRQWQILIQVGSFSD